jgi:hypothetical protein
MGVKRFLVAGGMASLVLIGVLLIVDAKGFAQGQIDPGTLVKGGCNQFPEQCQAAKDAANDPGALAKGGCNQFPEQCQAAKDAMNQEGGTTTGGGGGTTTGGGGGTTTGGGGGTTTGGDGGAGMEMVALGPGGTSGTGEGGGTGGGTTGGTDATGGAVAFAATASALPQTGGPSVVFLPTAGPLLLAIALLLGSGLCMAAFVRSGRS